MLPGWENFAVISGSAAGALTGLLFVAVSLNRDRIVGHAALRSEAGQTLAADTVGGWPRRPSVDRATQAGMP